MEVNNTMTKQDNILSCISSGIGIVTLQILGNPFKALLFAFMSGFVGYIGNKTAKYIIEQIKCKKNV